MIETLLDRLDISDGTPDIPDYLSNEGPENHTLFLLGTIEKRCPKELRKKGFPEKSLELTFFTNAGNYIDGKYEGYIQIYQINPYGMSVYYQFMESILWRNKARLIRVSAENEYYIPLKGEDQLSHAFVEESLMEKIDEFFGDIIDAEKSHYLHNLLKELCQKFRVTNEFQELDKKVIKEFSKEIFPLGYKKLEKFPHTKKDKLLYYTVLGITGVSGTIYLTNWVINLL